MKILDLFCGIGGLSLGFEMAGFEVISAIDMWEDAVRTYNYNRKKKIAQVISVEDFNKSVLPELISNTKVTGVIGGPPCQGFSTVGQRDINDPRNKLYLEFYKTVKLARPDFFVIENVRGLLTLNNGAFVRDILERFGEKGLGYHINYKLLNAANYGVPQNRLRVFFVGMKNRNFEFPIEENYILTAKDAIGDLCGEEGMYSSIPQNEYQKKMRCGLIRPQNHEFTSHSEKTVSIISQIPDGGNIKNLPRSFWNIRKYNKAFERMGSFKPSNTIDTGHRNYFHYYANRIPTVRESARIQSFPDTFEVLGTRGSQYKQIGNAVPPLLAYKIAEEIKKDLEK